MKIAVDAIVKKYVERTICDLCQNLDGFDELTQKDEGAQEIAFMRILIGMVVSGSATHRFIPSKKCDEFRAIERLIHHWGWVFGGAVLAIKDRTEMYHTHVKGHRSEYFSTGWDAQDPDNPAPSWPN